MIGEIAGAIAAREISAQALTELTLVRMADRNEALNAVTELDAERAMAQAAACDERIARNEPVRPLEGVPALVKDIEDVAGMRTTCGSLTRAAVAPAVQDGLVPSRLRAAGAVIVGKTNLPEYACEAYTANRLFGATRNPWGLTSSPGGSSGGSAAALAAGMIPIATATDGGGSIRIPAALSGLAGLKPTNGIIGRRPIPAWMDLSTDGPLATSVADLQLLLRVCGGPVAGDPTVLPAWQPRQVLPSRVFTATRTYDWGALPPDVAVAFDVAVGQLEAVLQVPFEEAHPETFTGLANPDDDWCVMTFAEQAHLLGREHLEAHAEQFDAIFYRYMQEGLSTSIDEYLAVRRRRFDYVRLVDNLLGDDGVLVTPTVTVDGIPFDGRMSPDAEPGVAPSALNTSIQNLTGHPAISLPAGVFPNGMPFGIQLTGPRFADGMLMAIGAAWEAAHPWPATAPGYSPFSLESLTAGR